MSNESKHGDLKLTEGSAVINSYCQVFYNPVQQFNRDLSIAVLNVYSNSLLNKKGKEDIQEEEEEKKKEEDDDDDVKINLNNMKHECNIKKGIKYENGLRILEALSATGLRSIRYAKEVIGIEQVIANDLSSKAFEQIKQNIRINQVEHLVQANCQDAILYMIENKSFGKQFDVVDLDPYGCAAIFLDSGVQCVKDGGMLMVTATDMAVLAGNSPETCYYKYGAVSLRSKCCHEMALRILLKCIESHANRYSRYIVPLLSISADFYIRVFVQIFTKPSECKKVLSKLSTVYECVGCKSITLHRLGELVASKNAKIQTTILTHAPPVDQVCQFCNHRFKIGGPIWSAPIHDQTFVLQLLNYVQANRQTLATHKRIEGVLSVVKEELPDVPLYYCIDHCASVIKTHIPSIIKIRSAFLNEGYRVSFSHANRQSIKTNAPNQFIWSLLSKIKQLNNQQQQMIAATTTTTTTEDLISETNKSVELKVSDEKILKKRKILKDEEPEEGEEGEGRKKKKLKNDDVSEMIVNYCIRNCQQLIDRIDLNDIHADANPESRKNHLLRFQENPMPNWGPGTRSIVNNLNDKKKSKRRRNETN